MAVNALHDPHDLHEELCHALTKTRGGKGVGEAAKRLLTNDAKGTQLVGITPQGNPVTYNRSSWSLRKLSIDEDGRHDQHGSSLLTTVERYIELEQWLLGQSDVDFAWVHPRYRWLKRTADSES